MDRFYNLRNELLTVMEIQEDAGRFGRFVYTLGLTVLAGAISLLALFSMNLPLFSISNDYEYTWEIKGRTLLNGITLDKAALTTFNPVMLIFYIFAGAALAAAIVYLVATFIHGIRAPFRTSRVLSGKHNMRLRLLIGVPLTINSFILLLFEPVYNLTKTAVGSEKMAELAANYSFNNSPTSLGVLLMIACFFIGNYFLWSAVKDKDIWNKHMGLILIGGIVVLVLYFWQYGYLHQLFGIDPTTSSFPYPFPRAINSFSTFTGSVKGDYNSVFGSLASVFFTSGSTILNDSIVYNSITTVSGMLVGYVLGGVLGYLIAVVASCSKYWGKGILTICTILVSFPVVALGPIVNHWFPSNSYLLSWVAKIIVVTILCMAGMSVNAYKGLTVMKPFTMDLMTMCNADSKTSLLKLRIPNSLPNVFTALKTNSATALMGAFVCEFYSLSKNFGIGMMFNNYWDTARYQAWAYIIMAILFGLILYLIVAAVEGKALAWYMRTRRK